MRAHEYLATFLLLISSSIARTQSFTNIVITPSTTTDARESRLQILPSGDLIARGVLVHDLLSLAYEVPENPSLRLSSLPVWASRQRFDIEAKIPASLNLASKDLATQNQIISQLLRNLLADRFGLVLSVKTERMPVYALAVVPGILNLKQAAITSRDCIFDTGSEGCHTFAIGFGHPLNANAVDMSDLARYLENWTDRPVVNDTALSGLFTMHSPGWKPMTLPPPPPGVTATGAEFASLPSLSTVLAGFGLQLLQQEASLPLYTVERIHQPSPN